MTFEERARLLTCALVGHLGEDDKEPRVGGSGFFVAPGWAVSARHVVHDLFLTYPYYDRRLLNRPLGDVKPRHHIALLQTPRPDLDKTLAASWTVSCTWDYLVADLALIEANPDNQLGHETADKMSDLYFEWSLLPPNPGETVEMCGVPSASLSTSEKQWNFTGQHVHAQAQVTEVFSTIHRKGYTEFPGFVVAHPVEHGFSGGPVFWNGRLCGLAAASLGDQTYVAALWPMCEFSMENKNTGKTEHFKDWLDGGRIVATDWRSVRGRVSLRRDDEGKIRARLAD